MKPRTRKGRYLAIAGMIAAKEIDFISPDYSNSPITDADYDALSKFAGETIFFDDSGFDPTEETRNERLMLLSFAATAT